MNLYQFIIILALIFSLNFLWNYYLKKETPPNEDIQAHPIENINKADKSNIIKYIFTFVAIYPLLIGLWSINYWLRDYNIALDTVNWTKCPGTILFKDVYGGHTATTTSQSNSGMTYSPRVEYEFRYKNETLKWSRIDYLNRPSDGNKKSTKIIRFTT